MNRTYSGALTWNYKTLIFMFISFEKNIILKKLFIKTTNECHKENIISAVHM